MDFLKNYIAIVITIFGLVIILACIADKFNFQERIIRSLESRLVRIETIMIMEGIPLNVFAPDKDTTENRK